MRKFSLLLSTIFLSVALISGCSESASNTVPEKTTIPKSTTVPESTATAEVNDAFKVAKEYKNAEYDIKNTKDILSAESVQKRNEAIKPYLTEQFYEKQTNTRITILPLEVANKQQLSLKPENLQFNLSEQKEDVVVLDYTLNLLLLDQGDKENKRIPIEGKLTLLHVNGEWLVQGDSFDVNILKKLIL